MFQSFGYNREQLISLDGISSDLVLENFNVFFVFCFGRFHIVCFALCKKNSVCLICLMAVFQD